MENILIINGSPRSKGTSGMLSAYCKAHLENKDKQVSVLDLYQHLENMEIVVEAVGQASTILVIGPCYVNTYPADVIRFLVALRAHTEIHHGQKLYGMIQGGMPYAHTHESGLNMLKIFSAQTGMEYCGGFIIGLGAMLNGASLDKLPNGKKTKRQLAIFLDHVASGTVSENHVYERALMWVPGIMARMLVRMMNNSIDKKYAELGFDANDPSPYLLDHLR